MNKVYKAIVMTAFMAGVAGSVYAKPLWAGPEDGRTAENTAETHEAWRAEKAVAREERKANRIKTVSSAWLYVDPMPEAVDYDSDSWGMVMVHHKRGWAMANAHNLEAGMEYTLYAGEDPVGEPTAANEYGDVHIRSEYVPSEESEEDVVWTLVGEDTTLSSTDTRIMPVKEDNDMEVKEGEYTEEEEIA